MNIFNKIFGKSVKMKNSSGFKKPDIEQLISSEDVNGSIIELDCYINELCEFGDKIATLTKSQKIFYYNQNLEREVNNGGFNQFYVNSSGDFAHETIDSLLAIGAIKTADIVKKANDLFPNGNVPSNRSKRQKILWKIQDNTNKYWEELDRKFFEYQDDLRTLNMDFIKKNINEF